MKGGARPWLRAYRNRAGRAKGFWPQRDWGPVGTALPDNAPPDTRARPEERAGQPTAEKSLDRLAAKGMCRLLPYRWVILTRDHPRNKEKQPYVPGNKEALKSWSWAASISVRMFFIWSVSIDPARLFCA